MKYFLPVLTSTLLFPAVLLTACGGGGSSTPTSSVTLTTPPTDIGFKLPSTLVASPVNKLATKYSGKMKLAKADDIDDFPASAGSSYAYENLKNQLSEANFRRLETNISLVYLDNIWAQVEENCSDVAKDDVCTIPASTVTLTYTQAIFDAEFAIYSQQFDADFLTEIKTQLQARIGETLTLGKIEYVVNSSGDFIHDVTVDLSTLFPDATGTAKEQVKWNADKTHVFTASFATDDTGFSISSFIDFNKTLDTIAYQDIVVDNTNYTFTFKAKVSSLNDGKNGVKVDSSEQANDLANSQKYSYQSTGRINDEGGRLTSSSTFGNQTFYNEETFDSAGDRTGGLFCDSSPTDCSDKANWTEDNTYAPIVESDPEFDDEDIFSNPFTVTGLPDEVEFFIVTESDVTAPTFEDAICVGVNFEIESEYRVDVSCLDDDKTDELLTNGAKVFEETFSGFDEETGISSVSYSEISGAVFGSTPIIE